jgi:hypoxanthine phosphoribosyltransferase
VRVDGLEYLAGRLQAGDRLLLVDDVHDTGLTLQQVIEELGRACGSGTPDIRVAATTAPDGFPTTTCTGVMSGWCSPMNFRG